MNTMDGLRDLPPGLLAALGALAAMQAILIAAALILLARTPADRVRHLPKWAWILAILLANGVGPIVFLAIGRERAAAPEAPAPARVPLLDHYPEVERSPGPAIRMSGVRKTFGDHVVLDDLSLEVPRGAVFGFLGPNGSGKTTALRILMGLSRPDSGDARIDGTVGYLPDVPAFDPWLTPAEYLRLSARLESFRGTDLDVRVAGALDLSGLGSVRRPISGLSRGMRQRLGIAQALVATPGVVILDEPTSALDPIARREVLDVIAALRGRATVFFSTHSMADVEAVCDHAAFLGGGRIVAVGTLPQLIERFGDPGRVSASFRTADAGAAARALEAAGCADVSLSPGGVLDDAFANAMRGAR